MKHIHLVSDSAGETVIAVAKAALAQFDHVETTRESWFMVRTMFDVDMVIKGIENHPGMVLYTIVDVAQRQLLEEACRRLEVPAIAVLDPVIGKMGEFFGINPELQPGRQYALDDDYFRRIEAMDFTLTHDDGTLAEDLYKADIILVGVSRTSKTPTSIYLANRGIKAANVPWVPNVPLPSELFNVKDPFIVALTTTPENLAEVRRNRLRSLNQPMDSPYCDIDHVRNEITEAKRLFARNRWPIIDVTRKSIEETAAAILNLFEKRRRKAAAQ